MQPTSAVTTMDDVRHDAERAFDNMRRCPHADFTIAESDQKYWDETTMAYVARCKCGASVVVRVNK